MAEYTKEIRKLIGSRPLILVCSTVMVLNDKQEILLQHRSDTKEWEFVKRLIDSFLEGGEKI